MSLMKSKNDVLKELIGEFYGTFIIAFGGCSSIATAILIYDLTLYGVAACWGVTVAVAIYASRCTSNAHLNPAVSIGFFLRKEISVKELLQYWVVQMIGGFTGGLMVYACFGQLMSGLEAEIGLGRYKTLETAQILCEFYPNPGFSDLNVSKWGAFGLEALGTFVLMLVILLIGRLAVPNDLAPVLIGLTIAVLIVFIAPYTQAGFNPARDFGPRTAAYFLGWNPIAFSNAYWLYILGPMFGASLAALVFPEAKKSEG